MFVMINKTTISVLLKSRATELGLNDAEIARRTGIEYRNYAHYASGKRTPPYDALFKICKVLELTPNDFFGIKSNDAPVNNDALERSISVFDKVLQDKSILMSPKNKARGIMVLYGQSSKIYKSDQDIEKEAALVISTIQAF